MQYLKDCQDATKQANRVIHELDGLLEKVFRGRELRLGKDMISEPDLIEDAADITERFGSRLELVLAN